ncbi:hypothetical protein [Jiella sonneratiae]|uniref:SH3 domain-containing protein n=1 Tax=Jiella sonneratiae TaxID=2816856 RepID=A0ABS3J732_9HYPH|nr:hypothetical protein [Jiella sonneratiae]MBO0905462.1 hypothetical protein [Jiella sonneratiae]
MPRLSLLVAAIFGALALSGPALAQSCDTYRVEARLLNMRAEPNVFGTILDVLRYNELVCVSKNETTGGQDWGYVVSKSRPDGSDTQKAEGWTSLRYLAKVDQPAGSPTPVAGDDQAGAVPDPGSGQTVAPPPDTEQPVTLSFSEPVPFGPFPVRGRTLEQLSNSLPLFSPIEGLPEAKWKRQCTTCHQWNKDRLCDQGKSYAANPGSIIRIQHPYGGPFKKALSTWAASGCQ